MGGHRLEGVEVGLAHREGRSRAAECDNVGGHLLEGVEVGLAHREGRSQTAERDDHVRGQDDGSSKCRRPRCRARGRCVATCGVI